MYINEFEIRTLRLTDPCPRFALYPKYIQQTITNSIHKLSDLTCKTREVNRPPNCIICIERIRTNGQLVLRLFQNFNMCLLS